MAGCALWPESTDGRAAAAWAEFEESMVRQGVVRPDEVVGYVDRLTDEQVDRLRWWQAMRAQLLTDRHANVRAAAALSVGYDPGTGAMVDDNDARLARLNALAHHNEAAVGAGIPAAGAADRPLSQRLLMATTSPVPFGLLADPICAARARAARTGPPLAPVDFEALSADPCDAVHLRLTRPWRGLLW
jgi:hypothetical protein